VPIADCVQGQVLLKIREDLCHTARRNPKSLVRNWANRQLALGIWQFEGSLDNIRGIRRIKTLEAGVAQW
jgi:hypothetical protein